MHESNVKRPFFQTSFEHEKMLVHVTRGEIVNLEKKVQQSSKRFFNNDNGYR